MSKRLIADGNTGRVAILEGGSRSAFDDPSAYMNRVYFHSDLDYLSVVQEVQLDAVTFPSVTAGHHTRRSGKKGKSTVNIPEPQAGVRTYILGNVLGDLDGPVVVFYNGSPLNGPIIMATSDAIWDIRDVYLDPGSGNLMWGPYTHDFPAGSTTFRSVSVGVASGQFVITETYFVTDATLPGQTLSGISVLKLNLGSQNPTSNETLHIEPTLFIASKGKLDSRLRYISKSNGDARAYLYAGRTLDLDNGAMRMAVSQEGGGYTDSMFYGSGSNWIHPYGQSGYAAPPRPDMWKPDPPIGVKW